MFLCSFVFHGKTLLMTFGHCLSDYFKSVNVLCILQYLLCRIHSTFTDLVNALLKDADRAQKVEQVARILLMHKRRNLFGKNHSLKEQRLDLYVVS